MKIGFGILVASLALQLAASPAFCANAQTSQKTSQSSSNVTNEHPAKERLSQLSTELLHQVDLARQAIGNKDTQAAKQHVNQALADQNRIASLAKSKNLPMIIPLYSEFDTSATLGPLESARKSGNKGQGNNSNQQKRNRFTPVTVEETAAEYTY